MIMPSAMMAGSPCDVRVFLVGVDVGADLGELALGRRQHGAVVPLDPLGRHQAHRARDLGADLEIARGRRGRAHRVVRAGLVGRPSACGPSGSYFSRVLSV